MVYIIYNNEIIKYWITSYNSDYTTSLRVYLLRSCLHLLFLISSKRSICSLTILDFDRTKKGDTDN